MDTTPPTTSTSQSTKCSMVPLLRPPLVVATIMSIAGDAPFLGFASAVKA